MNYFCYFVRCGRIKQSNVEETKVGKQFTLLTCVVIVLLNWVKLKTEIVKTLFAVYFY